MQVSRLEILPFLLMNAKSKWTRYDFEHRPDAQGEATLVIIKPDNFRFPSARPGNIIDIFSASGLRIVGAKVHRMSAAEGLEFYGPVQSFLREKLKGESELLVLFGDSVKGEGVRKLVEFGESLGIPVKYICLVDYVNSRGAMDMGLLPDGDTAPAAIDAAKAPLAGAAAKAVFR